MAINDKIAELTKRIRDSRKELAGTIRELKREIEEVSPMTLDGEYVARLGVKITELQTTIDLLGEQLGMLEAQRRVNA